MKSAEIKKAEIPEIGVIYGTRETLIAIVHRLMHGSAALEILGEQRDADLTKTVIDALINAAK